MYNHDWKFLELHVFLWNAGVDSKEAVAMVYDELTRWKAHLVSEEAERQRTSLLWRDFAWMRMCDVTIY